jgi:hypothetical protein
VTRPNHVAQLAGSGGLLVPGDDPGAGWIEHLAIDNLLPFDLGIDSGIRDPHRDRHLAGIVGGVETERASLEISGARGLAPCWKGGSAVGTGDADSRRASTDTGNRGEQPPSGYLRHCLPCAFTWSSTSHPAAWVTPCCPGA